jgi:hypothetical protein
MADRCIMFATAAAPDERAPNPANIGLCEVGYHIPAIFKLLVSVNPHSCRSMIFDLLEGDGAIAGDASEGLARLRQLRAQIEGDNAATEGIDAAIKYLSKPHMRKYPFYLLEPGEILGLSPTPFAEQIEMLLTDLRALRPEDLLALATSAENPRDWPTEWTNILYFEPEGGVVPPIDLDATYIYTTPERVLESEALLPSSAVTNMSLELEPGDPHLERALGAMSVLPKLVSLQIHGALERLPDSLARLSGLRTLVLGNMGLKQLPDSLAAMEGLEEVYLQQNAFDHFPVVLRHMNQLRVLSLWGNEIGKLPDWIGELQALEDVMFERCGLSALPESFFSLSALRKANLSYNPLGTLSPAVGKMRSLKMLSVYQCGLSALPESIGQISTLEELFAGENKLPVIPRAIADMPLQVLSIAGNPIKRYPWSRLKFKAKKLYL